MASVHRCGLYLMTAVLITQSRQTQYTNGWIPLTEDEVYSRTKMNLRSDNLRSSPRYFEDKADVNIIETAKTTVDPEHQQPDNTNIHDIRSKAIQLVKPDIKLHYGQGTIFSPIEPQTILSVNELQSRNEELNNHECESSENIGRQETFINIGKLQEVTEKIPRKSKAILDDSSDNVLNVLLKDRNFKLREDHDNVKRRFVKDEIPDENVYKVTEDPIEVLEDEESSIMKTSGYFYTPPDSNLNNPEQNNITHTFLDILSRHNIKPEDELPNYTLSRQVKVENPANAFMFIPVPLGVLPQFNNLKQLSVDPLLAVLMSNYGYYFPGSYGIHSRYRNLYGHLASNNIHNNKPFGSYKIFSDTDSSN